MKDEHKYVNKITKATAILFIGMFIGRFFGYLTRLIIARFFGAEAIGLFSMAGAIIGIATTIALLGIPVGVSRYISFYLGKKDEGRVRGTILSGLKITLPTGIIAGMVSFLFSSSISHFYFNEPELQPLLELFSFAIPFSVLLTIILHSYRGFQNMRYKVIIEDILKPLSTLLFIIVFFFWGYGIYGAVAAYTAGYIISAVVSIYFLSKLIPFFGNKVKPISINRELLTFSWPVILSGYIWMLIQWTDVMMLGFYWDATQVGLYNVAATTAGLLLIMADSIIYMFMPVISELFAKGKKLEIIKSHNIILKWAFLINVAFSMLMIFFPDNVLNVLFGQEFVAASSVLVILSLGYIISTPSLLSGSILTALAKTKLGLKIVLIGGCINVLLNFLLIPIPELKMNGAAIATLASFIVMSYLKLYYANKYMKTGYMHVSFIKSIISGSISILIFYSILKFLYSSPPWYILGGVFPLFLILYGFLFLLFKGIDKDDILMIKNLEKKMGIELKIVRKIAKKFL